MIEKMNFGAEDVDFREMLRQEFNHPELMMKGIDKPSNLWMLWNAKFVFRSHPQFFGAYKEIGLIYQNQMNDPESARIMYERALQIHPDYIGAHNNLAVLLQENHFKDFQGSKHHYEKAIELDPNYAEAHYNLGILLQGDHFKDFQGSKHHYEMAIKVDPYNAQAHFQFGFFLKKKSFRRFF